MEVRLHAGEDREQEAYEDRHDAEDLLARPGHYERVTRTSGRPIASERLSTGQRS